MLGIEYSPCYDCDKTKCSFCALTRYKDLQQKNENLSFDLTSVKAEIERLTINMNAFGLGMKRLAEDLATAKAEAIKDFVESLKGSLWKCSTLCDEDGEYDYLDIEELNILIDNLVKEMIGERE